ncbi:MAG: glycosyltransferase, partial [Bacteroidetes bacterium]|nr:glycosyltransferase [Bacteroidota bacterium]
MSNSELKPLISIILAAHNEELYIAECLDSIINQTYQNWELIAVNDHST